MQGMQGQSLVRELRTGMPKPKLLSPKATTKESLHMAQQGRPSGSQNLKINEILKI